MHMIEHLGVVRERIYSSPSAAVKTASLSVLFVFLLIRGAHRNPLGQCSQDETGC